MSVDKKQKIISLISTLPAIDKRVVVLHYNESLSFEEIGRVLDIESTCASRLYNQFMKKAERCFFT